MCVCAQVSVFCMCAHACVVCARVCSHCAHMRALCSVCAHVCVRALHVHECVSLGMLVAGLPLQLRQPDLWGEKDAL